MQSFDSIKDKGHFFQWLAEQGLLNKYEAMLDISTDYAGDQKHRLDAGDDLALLISRYLKIEKYNDVDWKGDGIWVFAFTSFLLRNTQAHTMDGLTYEDDGILWVMAMFESWARNQNVNEVPEEMLKKFMSPCTPNLGCRYRNEDCPVCRDIKSVEISKHDYHLMETEDGPHGSDWTTYRRNGENNWEVLMGESWEACYGESGEELEKLFKKNSDI